MFVVARLIQFIDYFAQSGFKARHKLRAYVRMRTSFTKPMEFQILQ